MTQKTETNRGNRPSAGNRTVSGSVSDLTRENVRRKPETGRLVSAPLTGIWATAACVGSRFPVSEGPGL